MTSWRESVSRSAQDDLDGLLNAALPFAQQMLDARGEFFPYGVSLSVDGEAAMVGGYEGDERPRSADVLSLLIDGLRRDRERLRATALVADVRTEASDAIRVELEHREGAALTVLLPYRRKRLRRAFEYDEIVATSSPRQIWPIDGEDLPGVR